MGKDAKRRHLVTSNNVSTGLVSNGRSNVQNVNANNVADSKNDTHVPAAVLEERLRRLENLQLSQTNNSSSDVYKFAFFFLMGIALTVLIYPKISTTLETVGVQKRTGLDVTTEQNVVPTMNEVDNNVDLENNGVGKIREKRQSDQIHHRTATNDSKDNSKLKENGLRAIKSTEALKEGNQNGRDDNANENLLNEQNTEPDREKIKYASRNDPMIDEDEDDSVMISLDDETEDDDDSDKEGEEEVREIYQEIPVKFESGEGWKADIEDAHDAVDEQKNTQKQRTVQIKTEKSKESPNKAPTNTNSMADTRQATKPTEKSKKTQSKDKENKKGSTKQKNNANEQKLPDEIKNFKPTYQKTVTPKKVFIDGRRIPPMELLPQKPNNSSVKVWLFEEFLSEQECDGLRRVHNKHVEEQSTDAPILCFDSVTTLRKHLKNVGKNVNVTPRDFTQGTTCVNETFSGQLKQWLNGNWSYSTAFYPGESKFATAFENRVQQAMGLNPKNGGKFQITSYPLGIGYKSHTDCTENTRDKRDRVATVLVYLDTVEEGGETDFPELGIWARPRKGRALLFTSMSPKGECEPMSIHKANKVLKGHKYILQRWYYYQSFYSLGKRPPEPPLPTRKPGQPRVSCDEYEHGSCRWYDEWNFEHMIEYERQKYQLV